jgi:ferric-dicitrate binding protein FerR (iron transport regulator)
MADEEDVTAHLLRLAGSPPEPPAARSARVRAAVRDAWRAQRRQRIIRRSAVAAVVCALAAALVIAIRMDRAPRTVAPPAVQAVLATGTRVQGRPTLLRRDGADAQSLSAGLPIHVGDVVVTDSTSRASLRMDDGSALRIDRASRVRVLAGAVIELSSGAAYLETADGSRGFEVRTPMGAVRDIGTRFEVRLIDSGVRIRVRAGRVELARGATVTPVGAGTQTIVTTTGVAVAPVTPYGPEWGWVATLAPSFAIEGHSLRAFLEHIAAEEGLTLRYASPAVAAAADRIILHGSVEGLRAEDALDVALATSGLQYRLSAGELVVSRPSQSG